MRFTALDYRLRSMNKNCAGTGKPLVAGSICYSAVFEKNGQFIREDYSEEGWSGPPEDAVGYWQSTVTAVKTDPNKVLDADGLMQYFEQMSDEGNEAQEKNRYVLSLLLLQKRKLILEGSRQDEEMEFLICSGKKGEGPFEVRNYNLPDEEIQQLQVQLGGQLAAG